MEEISWVHLVFSILCGIGFTMFMYRMRKGMYRVIGSTETTTLFKTSVGEFRLDKKNGKLLVKRKKGGWSGVEASDIRDLAFSRSEEPAWFWEIMTGFNLWDFSGKYRDQNILFKIDVVRNDGTYINLYEASQLEEREFWLWGWWVRMVRRLFEYLRLIKDVDSHSNNVYDSLKNEFRALGVTV